MKSYEPRKHEGWLDCKVFDKKNTTLQNHDIPEKALGLEIFFAKPGGLDLASALGAYICIRFYELIELITRQLKSFLTQTTEYFRVAGWGLVGMDILACVFDPGMG